MKNLRQVTIKNKICFSPYLIILSQSRFFVRNQTFARQKSTSASGCMFHQWICGFALKNGRITNTDVQEMAKVSKPTATRLLTSLSDYLEVKGTTGKGTYYVVKGLTKGSKLTK